MISRQTDAILILTALSLFASGSPVVLSTQGQTAFDVNDLSYLWPVPATTSDVSKLARCSVRQIDSRQEL
jgi:hypothetical protein